jgi:hypothetical protein
LFIKRDAVARYDLYHEPVKQALINDGWAITRSILKRIDPQRELFLAIAHDIYVDFFQQEAVKEILADYQIRLFVFDPANAEIIAWIN